eukprot:CAMPEP_0185808320 /NCGR_PEP_ID=MMETSP1322-20130828/5540_1 /TAXON_ID=265543 /ORGANISM="Minutocellus polymorphus, Strain RCC2270" /LENGTH=327 /DNA_ID=CAMNT_0028504527 /DNA_START=152 /DNA_END=1135 /DNA_ORIENTATION=-
MLPSSSSGGGGENGAGRSRCSNDEMNDAGHSRSARNSRNISSESATWVREYRDHVDLLDPKEFDDEFFGLNPLVQQGAASAQVPKLEETITSSDSPTNPGLPPKPDDDFLRGLSSESVARGVSSDSFFRDLAVDPYLNAAVEAQKTPSALPEYPPHPSALSNAAVRALSDDIRGMKIAPNEHKRKNDEDESSILAPVPAPSPAPVASSPGGRPGRRVTTKPPAEEMISTDEITEHDVLGGKGGQSIHHPGNIQFRQWAEEMKSEYSQLSKPEKTPYSWKLVHRVWENGGRFLEKDEGSGKFYVIDEKDARLKASQALREEKGRKKKK